MVRLALLREGVGPGGGGPGVILLGRGPSGSLAHSHSRRLAFVRVARSQAKTFFRDRKLIMLVTALCRDVGHGVAMDLVKCC
jgi:hypothetical protein